jgi:exopolysaccharide biosynthesis WecB/TagA/CpsF family protein
MKKFYFWGMFFVFTADILTVVLKEYFSVEYLFERIMFYMLIWMSTSFFILEKKSIKYKILSLALWGGVFFTVIQLIAISTGGLFVWGGEFFANKVIYFPGWSKFIYCVWVFAVTTIGVFVMKLMDQVNEDKKFVITLFYVLSYLVIFLGILKFGFYPMEWFYLFTAVYLSVVGEFIKEWIEKTKRYIPESENILGVRIDNVDKGETLEKIDEMVKKGGLHLVVTPYSEFFVRSQKDKNFMKWLNFSSLSIPDGVYVNWASVYKHLPASKSGLFRFFDSVWQYVFSGAAIVYYPEFVKTVIKDRVSGSDLIYDICKHASNKGYTVMFHGGWDFGRGNVGVIAAENLKKMYPKLKIVEVYPGNNRKESDREAQEVINKYKPDICLMCLGTREPQFVYERRKNLKCKVAVALGGTFDYVSKDAVKVGKPVTDKGLEWLLRPLMMKGTGGLKSMWGRFKRVWRGMLVGSFMMLAWKIKFGYSEQ